MAPGRGKAPGARVGSRKGPGRGQTRGAGTGPSKGTERGPAKGAGAESPQPAARRPPKGAGAEPPGADTAGGRGAESAPPAKDDQRGGKRELTGARGRVPKRVGGVASALARRGRGAAALPRGPLRPGRRPQPPWSTGRKRTRGPLRRRRRRRSPVGSLLKLLLIGALALLVLVVAFVASLAALGGIAAGQSDDAISCAASGRGRQEIPADLMPIYQSAAADADPHETPLGDRGVWVLAAINSIETDFGRNTNTSSAGAIGWMQFMPGTWRGYGVDADKDGKNDPYDPDDAIHAAAKLLRANGAPTNWYRAIFGYNHAGWYVKNVQDLADAYQGTCTLASGGGPAASIGDLDFNDTSGAWGGSEKFAKALLKLGERHGCYATSEKRDRVQTASGSISDHWVGSKNAYAVDIGNCSLKYPGGPADGAAIDIANALGMKEHAGGCFNEIHGRYRFQLIWQTSSCGGTPVGNHYTHVHVGVRLIG